MFVDGPCELVVEFPSKESKHNRHNSHDNGQSNQHRLDFLPEMREDKGRFIECGNGLLDLIELNGSIDENADIVQDEPDDLNCVLESQGVVYKNNLVDETKHEDGEVCGDGARLFVLFDGYIWEQTRLECAKDISTRVLVIGFAAESSMDSVTYASKLRAMTSCTSDAIIKDHVHFVEGIYILGARRTTGGSVVGKPSRSWYPPGCVTTGGVAYGGW
jgi:hypothetical protein